MTTTKFNSNNNMDIRCGELQVIRINKNYWTQCWFDSYADREEDDKGTIIDLDYKNEDLEEKIWDCINERVVHLYEKNLSKDDRHFEILYVIDEELEGAEQRGHCSFTYEQKEESEDESDEE